jgi:uncharacterized protein
MNTINIGGEPSRGPRPAMVRPRTAVHLDEPMRITGAGRTGTTNHSDHVRDMIRAVLFTEPGERANRPDFGCALRTMLFLPNQEILATATRTLVHAALQTWLEREIVVEDLQIEAVESELRVTLVYLLRSTGSRQKELFVDRSNGPR